MFVLYNPCGPLSIFSLFWLGAMSHAKIFHNYPESFKQCAKNDISKCIQPIDLKFSVKLSNITIYAMNQDFFDWRYTFDIIAIFLLKKAGKSSRY